MVRGVNGATASIVQSLQERCHLEHHIASKTTTVYPGPKVVPQHRLSRVVGKIAASENPIVKQP